MLQEKLFEGLNERQREAVVTTEGPVLVLAGAGTGKTTVITRRIIHLLEKGVSPEQILAVTFTNKAAREMLERVRKLLGYERCRGLTLSTFHAWCARFLRQHIEHLGYTKRFTIYPTGDQIGLLQEILRNPRIAGLNLEPKYVLSKISRLKADNIRPHNFEARYDGEDREALGYAYREYTERLQTLDAVDFDDLLLLTLDLFEQFSVVKDEAQRRYRYLMVDEYQDTNHPQYELTKILAERHANVCAVGDDDQSIYGFRGAKAGTILRFDQDFQGAKIIRLEQNYRSVNRILKAANQVIAQNQARREKKLFSAFGDGEPPTYYASPDPHEEALTIAGLLLRERQTNSKRTWGEMAILLRAVHQAKSIEEGLRQCKIPYHLIGGQSFFTRKEVADFLGYLRLIANHNDDAAFLRIINTPPRGIGATSLKKLTEEARRRSLHFFSIAKHATEGTLELRGESLNALRDWTTLIETFQARFAREPFPTVLEDLAQTLRYRDYLRSISKDLRESEDRWSHVREFMETLSNFAQRALEQGVPADRILEIYVQDLALENDRDEEDKLDKDRVQLMTVHAAKGLEFPFVIIAGMEEGLFPHQRSIDAGEIEEERRLCYVAVTRARERLLLTGCNMRVMYGKAERITPSRFLAEMELLPKEKPKAETTATPASTAQKNVSDKKLRRYLKDIKSRLR